MKKLELTLQSNGIGTYDQDCKVTIENKMDGVHVTIHEAKYPRLINFNLINWLINRQSDTYDEYVSGSNRKKVANTGWLNNEIARLERRIEHLKFIQKLAKRNNIFVFDKTE